MKRLDSSALVDPAYTVPVAEAAGGVERGLAWLRAHAVRFSDGSAHSRRRRLTEDILGGIDDAVFSSSATATLLQAMNLPVTLLHDVAVVADSYQPHLRQTPEADAAADRLVAACGGRTEEAAARVCILVQAYAATAAMISLRRAGSSAPPVPVTRRVGPEGELVEIDLTDAHFGRGPHRCPAEELAARFASEAVK